MHPTLRKVIYNNNKIGSPEKLNKDNDGKKVTMQEVEARPKVEFDISIWYDKACSFASLAWQEVSSLNLESTKMIDIPFKFATDKCPQNRLNWLHGKIKFLYSDACKKLMDEFNERLEIAVGFPMMNFRGPSGSGKTFAMLYLMMKLRLLGNMKKEEEKKGDSNNIQSDNNKYRVIYIDFAKDITKEGVLNHAILTAFYNDRKDIYLPPCNCENSKYADRLCYWYMASSDELLSKKYSKTLYDYCEYKNLKLIYIIDQENSLTSTIEDRKLADEIRQLPCHGMVVSASSNNEGFKTSLANAKFTTFEISNGFSEEQAKTYVKSSSYASIFQDDQYLEDVKRITGYRPLELSTLLHPDKKTAEKVSKLEPEPADVNSKEISEETSKISYAKLSILIDTYENKRREEISKIHRKFKNSMKDSTEYECLIYSYSVIDRGIKFKRDIALVDEALMYEENDSLHSLCPLAHNYFNGFLYANAESIDKALEIYIEVLKIAEDNSLKGKLLEEIMKCYFSSLVKKQKKDDENTISFSVNELPKDVKSKKESKKVLSMKVDKVDYSTLIEKGKGTEYYEKMFKQNKDEGVIFFPNSSNFPGIDCLILAKNKEKEYSLYGIKITINIIDHDKKGSSFQKFMKPSSDHPKIVQAFKNCFGKMAKNVFFIWTGGKASDYKKITQKIAEDSRKIEIEEKALCVFIENDPQYNSLKLRNAFE